MSIDFEQLPSSAKDQGHDKRGELWMSLITCGSIHEGHEWFSDDCRGRQEIFMCLAALLFEQLCQFANGSAKISIKSYFMRSFFFLSVFSSSEVLDKITSIRSKVSTTAWWSTCFIHFESDFVETSVPQTPQTNHSQNSSPVKSFNLIVESKSQPVELGNSTIELHVPSRRKKSLQSC